MQPLTPTLQLKNELFDNKHCSGPFIIIFAREEGIEPSLTVLETAFLPLKDSRKLIARRERFELT